MSQPPFLSLSLSLSLLLPTAHYTQVKIVCRFVTPPTSVVHPARVTYFPVNQVTSLAQTPPGAFELDDTLSIPSIIITTTTIRIRRQAQTQSHPRRQVQV